MRWPEPDASQAEVLSALREDAARVWGEARLPHLTAALEATAAALWRLGSPAPLLELSEEPDTGWRQDLWMVGPSPPPSPPARGSVPSPWPSPDDPCHLTATEAAACIRTRALSPVALVRGLLDRIDTWEPTLAAWTVVDAERALAAARKAEETLARGDLVGPLHGVPVGVKDIFDVAGLPTAAGFRPWADRVASRDAAAVATLRAAGAVILGKTVTTQFAYVDPPPTRNPWRLDRSPGGSSSGSAAAVGARMVPAALGSQTGGSVLRPASFCGVVGLKPTYDCISRAGILPLAWSLDHPGIIVRAVADAALFLDVLASAAAASPASPLTRGPGETRAPRLALLDDFLDAAEPEVQARVSAAVRLLRQAGAEIQETRPSSGLSLMVAAHHVVMQTEAAALHATRLAQLPAHYGPRIRAYVEVGQLLSGAAYVTAQRVRRRLRGEVHEALRGVDALLAPTVSTPAPGRETTGDPALQAPWSLLGLPSITIPCGLSDEGLPVGISLVAAPFAEAGLLRAAAWCEAILGPLPAPALDGPAAAPVHAIPPGTRRA